MESGVCDAGQIPRPPERASCHTTGLRGPGCRVNRRKLQNCRLLPVVWRIQSPGNFIQERFDFVGVNQTGLEVDAACIHRDQTALEIAILFALVRGPIAAWA